MSATTPLKEKLRSVPDQPGVYLMKDDKGHIIYVGKAKNLKSRVSYYFNQLGPEQFKTRALVAEILDFDIIMTKTEIEALLTERTLIRHHSPKFNILLRDDKEYPFIRVNFDEPWPRIEKVRRRKDDKAFYLGPFGNQGQLNLMLRAIGRIFPLIRCSRHEFRNAKRPCTYYHMNMCLGPCTLDVNRDTYLAMVKSALALLQGRNREIENQLKKKMLEAAEQEQFEVAAQLRDQLDAVSDLSKRQSVIVHEVEDADALGYATEGEKICFHVLSVRSGLLLTSDSFLLDFRVDSIHEAIESFLMQYYDNRFIPGEIFLPLELEGALALERLFEETPSYQTLGKVKIKTPQRGSRKDLTDMAMKNAKYSFEENERKRRRSHGELEALRDQLGLRELPLRMECIDISNLQGRAVVASNVCFVEGRPAKEFYRHYEIKTLGENEQNDFASIEEVVQRRLRRGIEEEDMPDLLVIDGGKGQLSAALKSKALFPEAQLEIVSLAKSRTESLAAHATRMPDRSMERVFFHPSKNPMELDPGSPAFRLLTQIRDEAHRFAISHHRKKRDKASFRSVLDEVSGIGPKMKQHLLKEFSGLDGLKNASLERLLAVKGLRESSAVQLHSLLKDLESKSS